MQSTSPADDIALRRELILAPYNRELRKRYLRARASACRALDLRQTLPANVAVAAATGQHLFRCGAIGGYLFGSLLGTPMLIAFVIVANLFPQSTYVLMTVGAACLFCLAAGSAIFVSTQSPEDARDHVDVLHERVGQFFTQLSSRAITHWELAWDYHRRNWFFIYTARMMRETFASMAFAILWACCLLIVCTSMIGGFAGFLVGSAIGCVADIAVASHRRTQMSRNWSQLGDELGPLPIDCPTNPIEVRKALLGE
jgi:hypothetical protein